MNLTKNTGINLSKGSSISLTKEGKGLEEISFGLNWGAIEKRSLFTLFMKESESVDLDGTVSMFDKNKEMVDTVYYKKLISNDGAVKHSGDDREGDVGGDDGKDNEVIYIDLKKINPTVTSIFVFLNSYKGQDFQTVPFSKIKIYEGNPKFVKSVFATFNLSAEPQFAGKISMIMGKIVKDEKSQWKFETIGNAINAMNIDQTIKEIQKHYL